MSMRIYTMTHKKFTPLPDPLYVPLHVGRACGENLGYLGDDTGEQISALNCYYSELTGFYWIWKNCHDADYVGTCHYRRYLINEKEQIYTEKEYRELLRKYDLVTTKKVLLNNSYYDGFLANHNIRALEMTGKVITEKYPEYADAFEQLVNGRQTYFGNILVTSKILFDEYASWLFSIFFEVAERIELETGEDAYHKRVFGFISEFLLLVWVTVKKLRVYECKVGMLGECFRNRDVDLAKKIFLETREKRPDVLMEASDITGELHLCMQIIATAGEERNHGETMILERENDFGRLMEIFSKLNRVVSRYRENSESEEDIRFLGEGKISKTAVWVAVMMGKESESEKKDLMDRMLKYLH